MEGLCIYLFVLLCCICAVGRYGKSGRGSMSGSSVCPLTLTRSPHLLGWWWIGQVGVDAVASSSGRGAATGCSFTLLGWSWLELGRPSMVFWHDGGRRTLHRSLGVAAEVHGLPATGRPGVGYLSTLRMLQAAWCSVLSSCFGEQSWGPWGPVLNRPLTNLCLLFRSLFLFSILLLPEQISILLLPFPFLSSSIRNHSFPLSHRTVPFQEPPWTLFSD
ncbi:hypothetical protein B0T17DRAFT_313837 [Bombardia bombarda]|uniref:Secreted protein n=1 Tax=Bombardia bombarda TaxID=252184 RepID=A0AA39WM13_9PEZI|nr:hypothetical protein B0T17DRAFT_313837 [Bombardia bombarda]